MPGAAGSSMLLVHELLQRRPIIGILPASRELNVTHPTVMKALDHLRKLEIVREVTGRRRGKLYCYARYMSILTRDTEAIRTK
jgi:Fic family protein